MRPTCAFLALVASLAILVPSIKCLPVLPLDGLDGIADALIDAKGGMSVECKEGCFGCCGGDDMSGGGNS